MAGFHSPSWNNANVRVDYVNMAQANKIRAWARKNHCIVDLSRYARDAYDGHVRVPMPQGLREQQAMIADLKRLLAELKGNHG